LVVLEINAEELDWSQLIWYARSNLSPTTASSINSSLHKKFSGSMLKRKENANKSSSSLNYKDRRLRRRKKRNRELSRLNWLKSRKRREKN
jgi:hypothetical protein